MGEKWLRYKVCLGLGKVGQGSGWWLVECEIEVLYGILAWGVLEKMKTHPVKQSPQKQKKQACTFCPILYSTARRGCTRRPALACVAVAVAVGRCRGLALHIVNYILTMLPWQHFVQLVKQFYFTLAATTIACTYSTYTNYSLQLQTIYALYNVRARAFPYTLVRLIRAVFWHNLHTLYNCVQF